MAVPACLVLSGLLGRSQIYVRPPHMISITHVNQVAVQHIENLITTRPFRWLEITANAGCRRHPAGDQFAIDDRVDESFKSHDRPSVAWPARPRRPAPRKPPAYPGTTGIRRPSREGSPQRRTAM